MDILRKKYARLHPVSDFESFEMFLEFCKKSGYREGYVIRRHNLRKPHGPDNSYFDYRKPAVRNARIKNNENKPPAPKSPCESCKLECTIQASGCAEWREWFVKNWDKNIHRKVVIPKKRSREAFRYEHPDLVREGIIWNP